jgi:hypothetical protein
MMKGSSKRRGFDRWLPLSIPAFFLAWTVADVLWFIPADHPNEGALFPFRILKVVNLAAVLFLLGGVHRAIFRNRRRTLQAIGILAIAWGTIVLALSATRSLWAPYLSDDVVRYYTTQASGAPADWLSAWSHGIVTLQEVGLTCLFAVLHGVAGYCWGKRPVLSVFVASATSLAILAIYVLDCPWDTSVMVGRHLESHLGDCFPWAVLDDWALFWTLDSSYTFIAAFFYLAVYVASHVFYARQETIKSVATTNHHGVPE